MAIVFFVVQSYIGVKNAKYSSVMFDQSITIFSLRIYACNVSFETKNDL